LFIEDGLDKNMPTEKPIINFAVDEEFFRRIDDYRFENRINTRSEAIRRLIEEALERYEKQEKKAKK
jgi:metal-responsive CopG/Arc/MetJ family transcriptional regulator